MAVTLRPAAADDVAFIMGAERGPGFEAFVGRWPEAQHRETMAKPSAAYLVGERDGAPAGFAILTDLDDPHGNVLLRRIVAARPGEGFGRAFLTQVVAAAFGRASTHRLWLSAIETNARARHLYRSSGFREEGVLREAHRTAAGERVCAVVMAMLRREWEALGP